MTRMETLQDVINEVISHALGENAADYDLEAIAKATYELVIDENEDGQQLANTARFIEIPGVDFWEVVAMHHING